MTEENKNIVDALETLVNNRNDIADELCRYSTPISEVQIREIYSVLLTGQSVMFTILADYFRNLDDNKK